MDYSGTNRKVFFWSIEWSGSWQNRFEKCLFIINWSVSYSSYYLFYSNCKFYSLYNNYYIINIYMFHCWYEFYVYKFNKSVLNSNLNLNLGNEDINLEMSIYRINLYEVGPCCTARSCIYTRYLYFGDPQVIWLHRF